MIELIKYPKIKTLGYAENEGILDELVVCESKIDGANFRCRFDKDNDRLVFGSRNNHLESNTNPEKWIAIRSYKKAFELYKDNFIPDVIYYSESMQKHTLDYDNIPDTIGYDIWDIERECFYDWKASKQAFENIGIPFIHVHFEKHGKDITIEELKDLYTNHSPYRGKGDEGIVLKCYKKLNIYGNPLFAKLVDDLFKEENKKLFKNSHLLAVHDNTNDIINRYYTPARFEKAIFHFKDEGENIDMYLMPKLFKYIGDDILSENILYISGEWKSINFKTFYTFIAKKCAIDLKHYLNMN